MGSGRHDAWPDCPRTIEMHLSRLMATLRCRTRSEAVARAIEMRLLDE